MKKLFLLDAMALIYRAHFAFSKNPRINSKGLNTGAVLGFANSLVEILEKEKPTHIAVAFDTPEPTFRHQAFENYKAQREQQPEDITVAIPYVMQLLEAFQISILLKTGYEADDIIGTIAKKSVRQDTDLQVFMTTMDKDYGQLVEDRIWLYKPSYLGNDVEILGVPEILAKWEISQISQITDILGLQGDAVDNIPGIPGIGEKTAKKLIQEFGSIENLIQNVDMLKGKMQENVRNFAQQALLSKQLATIDTNVPIDFQVDSFVYNGFNETKLKALFDELEFRTLAKRLLKNTATQEKEKNSAEKSSTTETDLFGNTIANKEPQAT
ncbi:MAG: 5'-3' exonuclease H3TH domain-containing protein, partial [Raineya sp.]|nr:5'-3' exonuclease H3TH domain-containing protein [Raineya sp.]